MKLTEDTAVVQERDPAAPRGESVTPMPGPSTRPAASRGLSRSTWYFIVDVLLLVPFLALVWTSAVVRFVFPRGTVADGYSLWGMSHDRWCDVQFGALCVFCLVVLIHVLIHWAWICNYLASRLSRWKGTRVTIDDGLKTIYGVGFLIVLLTTLGLALAVASVMIARPA
jgi:hypothetical protein